MSFSDDVRKASANMLDDTARTVKGIKFALFRRVILDTPVDTGRLAGNWQSTIGAPATGTIDRKGAGSALSAIVTGDIDDAAFLTNNLPYAEVVEFGLYPEGPKTDGGYSKKAPEGMVRRNADRVANIIRNARRAKYLGRGLA